MKNKNKMEKWSVAIPYEKFNPILEILIKAMTTAEKNGLSMNEFVTIYEMFRKQLYAGQPPNAFVNAEAVTPKDENLQKAMKEYQTGFKKRFEK